MISDDILIDGLLVVYVLLDIVEFVGWLYYLNFDILLYVIVLYVLVIVIYCIKGKNLVKFMLMGSSD